MPAPDDLEIDFALRPWTYPGVPAATAGLLADGRFEEHEPAELRASWTQGRTAVVAVGSNASPGVVHRKLAVAGVATTVPFLLGRLHGVACGHSAHVSRHGYLPAAPYAAADAVTAVTVSWFTDEQLAVMDASEPHYARRRVAARVLELVVTDTPDSWLYDSVWGVLAERGGARLTVGTQRAVLTLLAQRWPPFGRLGGDAATLGEVTAVLATDSALRARWREELAHSGWALESGLGHWPAAGR